MGSYYASANTKQEPKGTIDMEEAISVDASQKWPGPQSERHPFVFTIETKSGRIYYLSAASKDLMLEWVAKLVSSFKFYLEQNKTGSGLLHMCGAYCPDEAADNYANGVIPVNISLAVSKRPNVMISATESTTAREVVLQALTTADKPADTVGLCVGIAHAHFAAMFWWPWMRWHPLSRHSRRATPR